MDYLIQNVEITDIHSEFHRQKVNLLIENGVISKITNTNEIAKTQSQSLSKINAENLKLSIGWFDMRASLKDPGYEHKETLTSGCAAAMKGGFTEVAILPNTSPVIHSKNEIAYIQNHNRQSLVELYPIAAVSLNTEGKELTEMIDLHTAGAVAFSDGECPIWHSDMFIKTLLYLQKFNGLLINRPEDTLLTQFGAMNEGIHSTLLGLKGIPKLAEEMMVQRDLSFLEYAGGRLHFSVISSAKSVELIREAKQKDLQVTCDIAAHQIAFDDSTLMDFDSRWKVNPPFRTTKDIEALWQGLEDGTIDAIVSDHNPQDIESKQLEFDLAEFGIIGLETAFAVINTHDRKWGVESFLTLDELVEKFTYKPRQILNLPIPKIAPGEKANLTLFNPEKEWIFTQQDICSKSKNSPFLNQTFKGKALAVFNKNKFQQVDESLTIHIES